MSKMIGVLLLWVILAVGQGLEIINIKPLQLEEKRNFRSPTISPDGRYLSFESIKDKDYWLFLYDIKANKVVKLGKTKDDQQHDQLGFTSMAYGNEVTNQLSWHWNRRKNRLYFDFIHSPMVGVFQLYRGAIRSGADIQTLANLDIASSLKFEKYAGLKIYNRIMYPILSNTSSKNHAPLVSLTIDRRLAVFNHAPNSGPNFLTTPPIQSADMTGKFSSSDRQILFMRDFNEKSDIGLIKRTGPSSWKKETILINSSYSDVSPEWCFDEKKFAYYSDYGHPKQFSIFIKYIDGGEAREVIRNVARNHGRQNGPAWVDDKGILFVRRDIKHNNPLMYYDLRSGKEKMIATNTASNEDVVVRQTAPDLYLVAFTARGEIKSKDDLIWTKIYLMKIKVQ